MFVVIFMCCSLSKRPISKRVLKYIFFVNGILFVGIFCHLHTNFDGLLAKYSALRREMSLDTSASKEHLLLRRLRSSPGNNISYFPTVLNQNKNIGERKMTSSEMNVSCVPFGGKNETPFIGKTLSYINTEDDKEGNKTCSEDSYSPPMLLRDSFDSDEESCQNLKGYIDDDETEELIKKRDWDGNVICNYRKKDVGETDEEELQVNVPGNYENGTEGNSSCFDSDDDSDTGLSQDHIKSGDKLLVTFVSGKAAASNLGDYVHRPTPIMGGHPFSEMSNLGFRQGTESSGDEFSSIR